MTFWRPAEQWRGEPFQWMRGHIWKRVEMNTNAALAIYRHICVVPALPSADNDRDHIRW